MVRELGGDVPALALRKLATDAELVSDRRVPLVLRRVPGVDGDLHLRSSSVERSDSTAACANVSRAACRASSRTSASSASSVRASVSTRERRTCRATPVARAAGLKRDPLRPRMIPRVDHNDDLLLLNQLEACRWS